MYLQIPSDKELSGTGFTREDYEEDAEVWPENWLAFEIFGQLQTQWTTGMAGPTGLMYPALFDLLDRHGLKDDDWWQMFGDIRTMEHAALAEIRRET